MVSLRRAVVCALTAGATVAAGLPAVVPALATAGALAPAFSVQPEAKRVGSIASDTRTFSCQLTTPAGCYGPTQIRAAYGVDQLASKFGLDGSGRSITIIDAFQSPTIQDDLTSFDTLFGLPAATLNIVAPDGLTPFDQTDADQTGWAGEITLDVEYAHAIAPGATINLVLAKSDNDTDIQSALSYVVSHNLGDVISQSYGEAEQCVDPAIQSAQHALFAKATAQGQTVLASSGDQGAALPNCDQTGYIKAVNSPASDPLVTAVGGTILDADGQTGAYHGETTWNEPDYASAGGGGVSVLYKEPSYQLAAQHTGARTLPDISYNAAINGGVLAVWSSSGQGAGLVFRFGGTSAGSPQWAGLVALTDQLKRGRVGAINSALYGLAVVKPVYSTEYHDVTTGNNSYDDGTETITGYSAGPGYDLATGLGTPKAQYLVPSLAGIKSIVTSARR